MIALKKTLFSGSIAHIGKDWISNSRFAVRFKALQPKLAKALADPEGVTSWAKTVNSARKNKSIDKTLVGHIDGIGKGVRVFQTGIMVGSGGEADWCLYSSRDGKTRRWIAPIYADLLGGEAITAEGNDSILMSPDKAVLVMPCRTEGYGDEDALLAKYAITKEEK